MTNITVRIIAFLFVFGMTSAFADGQSMVPYRDQLLARAKEARLAEDLQWLNLLHYKRNWIGLFRSQVQGDAFFLSEEGAQNPEAELLATLEGFFATTERAYENPFRAKDAQYPRCQFPARFAWLQKKLNIDEKQLPPADCTRFEKYKKGLSAKSVTLVFSSYYLNNPSSTFGHSFLRFNKSTGTSTELLDYGVNYAANVTSDNALIYGVSGLLGFFRGTYSQVPYYYKVREYNDYEARDLWSYDLNLTDEEIALLVSHLWELGSSYFSYYYFTQNCSYQILTALEAAAPRFRVTDKLPALYVIPSDTIRQVMATEGMVKSVSFRPSIRAQFYHRLSLLNDEERGWLKSVAIDRRLSALPTEATNESKARVLDAALDYMDLSHPEDLLKKSSETAAWKQKILFSRAEVPVKTSDVKIVPPDSEDPHSGHGSSRVSFGAGYEKTVAGYAEAKIRLAFHDFLDPSAAYPKNAQVEMMNLGLRYYPKLAHVELEDLALIRLASLNPVTAFNKSLSWRVELGGKRMRDQNCDRCFAGVFELGFGYALVPSDALTLFAFGDGEVAYSPRFFKAKMRPGVGPTLGFILGSESLRAVVKGGYRYYAFSEKAHTVRLDSDLRANFSQSFGLNLHFGSVGTSSWDGGLSALFYY